MILLSIAVCGCTAVPNWEAEYTLSLSEKEIQRYYDLHFPVETNGSPRLTVFPPEVEKICDSKKRCGQISLKFPVSIKPQSSNNSLGIVEYKVLFDTLHSGSTYYFNPVSFSGDDGHIPLVYRETARANFKMMIIDHFLTGSQVRELLEPEKSRYFDSSDIQEIIVR